MSHPVSLDSQQVQIVTDAVLHVEHPRRHRFIDALLDRLLPIEPS